jgi:hypothetical protein
VTITSPFSAECANNRSRSLSGTKTVKNRYTTRRGSFVFIFHSVVDAIDAYVAVEKHIQEYNSQVNTSTAFRPRVEFLDEKYSFRGVWWREEWGGTARSERSCVLPPITIKDETDSTSSSVVG